MYSTRLDCILLRASCDAWMSKSKYKKSTDSCSSVHYRAMMKFGEHETGVRDDIGPVEKTSRLMSVFQTLARTSQLDDVQQSTDESIVL